MPELLTVEDWTRFEQAINDAGDTFNNTVITWRKFLYFLDEFNEDLQTAGFQNISLNCLFNDNYFHSWPITFHTKTGELDRESTVIILNRAYLNDLGYINTFGNFDFNPAADRFIHNGIIYKCEGWTDMADSKNDHLLIMIILKREDANTGTNYINPITSDSVPVSIITPPGSGGTELIYPTNLKIDVSASTDFEGNVLPFDNTINDRFVIVDEDNATIANFTIQRDTGDIIAGTIPSGLTYDEDSGILSLDRTLFAVDEDIILYYTVFQNNIQGSTDFIEIGKFAYVAVESGEER